MLAYCEGKAFLKAFAVAYLNEMGVNLNLKFKYLKLSLILNLNLLPPFHSNTPRLFMALERINSLMKLVLQIH